MHRLLKFLLLQELEYEEHQFSAQGGHFLPSPPQPCSNLKSRTKNRTKSHETPKTLPENKKKHEKRKRKLGELTDRGRRERQAEESWGNSRVSAQRDDRKGCGDEREGKRGERERERNGNGGGLSLAIFDAFGRGLSIHFNPLTYQ